MSEETLALDELHDEVKETDINELHADQMLYKIAQLEKEIEEIKEKQMASAEFYDRRIESVLKQIQYRANFLESFMMQELKSSNKKTAKMPNGTLRVTSRTVKHFGESSDLIKFSYDNNIPTRVTEKPDKKAISNFIKETAHAPNDYEERIETSFSYKTNNQQ
jgi:hypothetical protein